jgi:hypothetical protein
LFSAGGVATFGELDIDPDGLTTRIFDGAGALLAVERLAPIPARRATDGARP